MRVPEFRGKEHHSACFFGKFILVPLTTFHLIQCIQIWSLLLVLLLLIIIIIINVVVIVKYYDEYYN